MKDLTLEALEKVTGGTAQQTQEILEAIKGNPKLLALYEKHKLSGIGNEYEICNKVLAEVFDGFTIKCDPVNTNDYLMNTVYGDVAFNHNYIVSQLKAF
jgi:hypothetical protein